MLCSLIPDTFCKKGKRDYEKAKFEKYLSCLLEPPNLNDLGQLGFIGAHVGFFLFKTSRFSQRASKLNKYPEILCKQLQKSGCQDLRTEFSNT